MRVDVAPPKPLRAGALLAAAFAVLSILWVAGCGYPRVSEPALRLAQAIDTITNLRDPEQIPKARDAVEKSLESGEIAEAERDLLQGILDQAEAGDWEGAEANVRSMLHAQNEG